MHNVHLNCGNEIEKEFNSEHIREMYREEDAK